MLHTLRNLPRDARDTLFLLVVIAWIIAPQVGHLPVWCTAMAAAILVWRGWTALQGLALPSRWWLLALLVLATAATLFTHRTLFGQEAGVTFIVVLLALKTLEMRARRDAFVIFFLGFFTMLSNFFVSQSLLTAACMLVALLGLLSALVNSQMPVGRPPLAQVVKRAAGMALLGAPIMVLLFMLFPRLAPLWGVPTDSNLGRSGLNERMQVGTMARLALDSSVAMRLQFDGPTPRQEDLYFRGPVLSSFDGREWSPLRSGFSAHLQTTPQLQVSGPAVSYQVTLEGNNRPWVLTLDATPQAPSLPGYKLLMKPDLQWVTDRPLAGLVRYQVQSYPRFRHGPSQAVVGMQDYLELPPGFNPRTLQLAADLRRNPQYARADAANLVDAVLQRLRTGGYTYTLEPGLFGTHSADEFWFDNKQGFCEHIASSFVVLMRALDIPARIVTGYQGGEANPVDGLWTVRQSDAHAWAEVWMGAQGWVRVDPTSAIAPARTGSLQRLQPPTNAFAQAIGAAINPAFAMNLRAMWEAANNRWNQWVLNYTQTQQLNLLRNLGFESPSWQDLTYVLIGIVVLVSLAGAAWTLWERHHQDPWLRLLQRATHQLRRAGLDVASNTPPRRLATLVQAAANPGDAACENLCAWLLRLEAWRYGSPSHTPAGRHADNLGTLRHQYRKLSWPDAHYFKPRSV
jgi:protein-glutamine gamma-glutamyltransferase